FGFSYLFGVTGTTNLTAMHSTLAEHHASQGIPMATLAMVLAAAGLGFRITAVPFHYYAPDVYQGGPIGVITQLAVIPKLAGFVALAKVLGLFDGVLAFPTVTQIPLMLWVLAAITMTIGNMFALVQENLKRLLAYSGVAHAGYMLIGLAAAPTDGAVPAVLVYLVAYILMTVGVFAVIAYLNSPERPVETIDDLAGAGQSHPIASAFLAVALLSLIGIPMFAGFWGKLGLFVAAFRASGAEGGLGHLYQVLTVVAAVNAAIGAIYYLKLLGVLYLRSPLKPPEPARGTGPLIAAGVCAVATLVLGIYPNPVANIARESVPSVKSIGR
ncbi:MAG: NADH-quinone oxidoreductase subunit N, partial [Gemmataceae bacterium]